MVDVVQLGYSVDTSQVLKGEQALEDLTATTLNADAATKTFDKTAATTGATLGRTATQAANLNRSTILVGGGARQLGVNLSQVAQAGAVTGNYFQALTVQAADLGLAFGSIGIAVGAAITVLGPYLASLIGSAEANASFADTADDLGASLAAIRSEVSLLTDLQGQYVAAVVRGQDEIAGALLQEIELRGSLLQFQRIEQEQQLAILQDGLRESQAAFEAALADARNAAANVERDLSNEGFTRTQQQEAILQATRRVLEENRGVLLEYQKQSAEAALIENQIEAIDRLLAQASGGAANLADGLGAAAAQAANAALSVQQIFDRQNKVYSGRGPGTLERGGQVSTLGGEGIDELIQKNDARMARIATGGRAPRRTGGGRADPYEGNLNSLIQSLESEREALERWYRESQTLLEDRRALEFLTEQEHKEALLGLEQEFRARQAELARQAAEAEIEARANALNAVGGLLGVFASENRAAAIAQIALNKGLAIAQAIQNTAVAQTRALAELGPIAGPPMAARIAAWGRVQIAAIAATGLGQAFGGGGGGGVGRSGARGVSAAGPSARDVQVLQVEILGDGPITEIFESIMKQAQKRNRQGLNIEVVRR